MSPRTRLIASTSRAVSVYGWSSLNAPVTTAVNTTNSSHHSYQLTSQRLNSTCCDSSTTSKALPSTSTTAASLSTRARARARIAQIDSTSSPQIMGDPSPTSHGASSSHSHSTARMTRSHARQSQSAIVSPFLTDSFDRAHDYLRISLTEKCNLRCTYCMPESGVKLLPRDDLLTTDEIERVGQLFVSNGVTKIRLTGGEPTVRKDLIDVVARLGRLPLSSLGMTSNGIALKRKLPQLVDAGLTHLNISLDTLDPIKYELMTRRSGFNAVMESLEVARGLKSRGLRTKINVVVIRGLNDDEVPKFVELTKKMDITVRFIEYMPFEDNRWSTSKLVPSADLVAKLRQTNYPNLEKLHDPHSDTTRSWRIPGYVGQFGFISSMSDHFCGECSRLRVGADGGVKVCLFGPPVLALRPLLRAKETTDEMLMQRIGSAVWGKKFAHNGLGGPEGIKQNGKMGPMVGIAYLLASQPSVLPFMRARLFSSGVTPRSSSDKDGRSRLTHIDARTGKASMVDVSSKAVTLRSATASGRILLNEKAWSMIDFPTTTSDQAGKTTSQAMMKTKKGDVLTIAHLAGLMATKQTSSLIPLCHPLLLSNIKLLLVPEESDRSIRVECTVQCEGKTGVEMEALMGVNIALLTIWDMCKAVAGEQMTIEAIKVVKKSGGQSGDWIREGID